MTPVSPVPATDAPAPWAQRLVEQLQLLSEVTESLTYRLLDLEERLAGGERELALLQDQLAGEQQLPDAMEDWLEDTQARLGRVEELLRGGDSRSPAASRPLRAVTPALSRPVVPSVGMDESDEADASDPFPEEGEQPFLDEQIA